MRTKQVFPTDEVAHLFANRLQESARNRYGNFYFEKDSIYSYGRHFCIAKFVTNEKGETKLLFTMRRYSNTTANQIGIVRHATNHLDKLYCPDPEGGFAGYTDHDKNVNEFVRKIKGELAGLVTAKKPEKYIEPAKYVYGLLEKYCEFFGLAIPLEAKQVIENADNGKYKEYLQAEKARIEAIREAQRIEAEKQAKKMLLKWRKFKGESRLYNRLNERDYLRFNTETKRVETSQRVEIPEIIAKRAYNWIKATIKNGGYSGECEYKILDYTVSMVSADLITIGCHKIDIKEIDKLAKQLGWTNK